MQMHEPDPAHARQVARLSSFIYDLLIPIHLLKPADRILLRCAALLHDTGWSIAPTGKSHHKHSAAIIRSHPWKHLDADEIEIVSQAARYHRKKLPSTQHDAYARLSHAHRQRVSRIAALLRIADALDRSHQSLIRSLTAELNSGTVQLRAISRGLAHEEEYGFLKKRDLFVQQFERGITLDVRTRSAR